MNEPLNHELLSFIGKSPTVFHAVDTMKAQLAEAGFIPLEESSAWQLAPGRGYYVTRNASALIAFRIPEGAYTGFQIVASHGDSPSFKIKDNRDYRGGPLHQAERGGLWRHAPRALAGPAPVRGRTGGR